MKKLENLLHHIQEYLSIFLDERSSGTSNESHGAFILDSLFDVLTQPKILLKVTLHKKI